MNGDEIRRTLDTYSLARGEREEFKAAAASLEFHGGSKICFARSGVTAIVGANNCGKSTLLNQITALLQNPGHLPQPPIAVQIESEISGTREDVLDWFCENTFLDSENIVGSPMGYSSPSFQRDGQRIPIDYFTGNSAMSYQSGAMDLSVSRLFPFLVRYIGAGLREPTVTAAKNRLLDPPTMTLQYLQEDPGLMDELNGVLRRILGVSLHLDDLNQTLELRVGTPKLAYPGPRDDRDARRAYQLEVEDLPKLDDQGDGMRSLMGILLPLITANNKILILDEPEAFLHPPQSFALGQEIGRIADKKNVQVILATHDKNLLAGLLHAGSPLSVVRLRRNGNDVQAHQLLPEQLREMWDDPVLKYSNVLDGLFHELVVLAEADRDCRFYEAALDARPASSEDVAAFDLPATQVLFVPTGGLGGMAKAARTLRALHVPVIASPDLDALSDSGVLSQIVQALGNRWQDIEEDWATVTNGVGGHGNPTLVAQVRRDLNETLDAILNENTAATFEGAIKRRVEESLRSRDKPWNEVKHHGVDALMRLCSDNTEAVRRLLDELAGKAVVLVEAGELESFGFSLGLGKGKAWVPAALDRELHTSPEVQSHIERLIAAARPLIAGQSAAG